MFQILDIEEEARKIIGLCDDLKFFRWCSDVVTMISFKADLEGWKGELDICTAGCSCESSSTCNCGATCGRRCVSLPREVETVLGVNIGGQPALGFGQLFNFHINGPGDLRNSCDWSWQDKGNWHFTYRDLITPAKLVAFLQSEEDNGKSLVVMGYDSNGNVLRRNVGGKWLDGYQVPTVFGYAIPDAEAPTVARITGVIKDATAGSIRLATTDSSGGTGVNLAVYEPDERIPQYRRIMLNRSCNWVRVAYLRSSKQFTSRYDRVPLNSRLAFLIGMQARKFYATPSIAEAHAYEADAARLELEVQSKLEPTTTYNPIQVIDRSQSLRAKDDYDIR